MTTPPHPLIPTIIGGNQHTNVVIQTGTHEPPAAMYLPVDYTIKRTETGFDLTPDTFTTHGLMTRGHNDYATFKPLLEANTHIIAHRLDTTGTIVQCGVTLARICQYPLTIAVSDLEDLLKPRS